MYNDLIREATDEEMAIYEAVNEVFYNLDDDEAERFTETVSNIVFKTFDKATDRAYYQRAYRLGKKYGFTVNDLFTWYCID